MCSNTDVVNTLSPDQLNPVPKTTVRTAIANHDNLKTTFTTN